MLVSYWANRISLDEIDMESICSREHSSTIIMSLKSVEDFRFNFRTAFSGVVIIFLEEYFVFRGGVRGACGGRVSFEGDFDDAFLDNFFSASAIAFFRNALSSFVGIRSSTFIIVVSLRAGFRKTIIRVLSLPFCLFRLRLECLRIPAPENASLSLRMMQITADSDDRVEAV